MSPVYEMYRTPVGEPLRDDQKITKAILLHDGDHTLSHGDFSVPVTVEGNAITIHVSQAQGDLRKGEMNNGSNDIFFEKTSMIRDITMDLDPIKRGDDPRSKAAVRIRGEQPDEPTLSIERHDGPAKHSLHGHGKERE